MSHVALEIATPHGPARAHMLPAGARAAGGLVLGHGAGGGVGTVDLRAAAQAARGTGLAVALVEQPYRVAGRRSPAPARQLDAAWLTVVEALSSSELEGLALFVGGRSSGARVACRTAAEAGAVGVVCLAFPVHPPGRSGDPAASRLNELDAVAAPTLVVQGERDAFGMPPDAPGRTVVRVSSDHSLRNAGAVEAAVAAWLARQMPARAPAGRPRRG